VFLDTAERGGPTSIGIGVASVGCVLVACGITALFRRRNQTNMPSGARLVVTANVLFLAFFSLEFSDLMVRQERKIIYWTNFLFPPGLILFWGLVTTRRWAWWMSRIIAVLGVIWFLGFSLLIPFGNIRRDGVPATWDQRAFMILLSLGFASVLICALWSIGRPETRRYFGLIPRQE